MSKAPIKPKSDPILNSHTLIIGMILIISISSYLIAFDPLDTIKNATMKATESDLAKQKELETKSCDFLEYYKDDYDYGGFFILKQPQGAGYAEKIYNERCLP